MAGLDGTVKVPGLGNVKKAHVAAAAGVGAVIVGVGFYRKSHSTTAAVPVVAADGTSDAFDTTPAGPGGSNGVTNQFGDPVPPQIIQQNPGIQTNLDWVTSGAALDLGGIDSSVISKALSKALGGIATTQAEQEIVHEVIGSIGPPPQGMPPLKLSTSGGTVTGTAPTYIFGSMRYVPAVPVKLADAVRGHSAAKAPSDMILHAIRATADDPANHYPEWLTFYHAHGNVWIPGRHTTILHTVVVKK